MNDRSQEVVDTLGLDGAERRRRRWWPVIAAIAIVALAAGAYTLRQHRTTAPQFVTDSVRQGPLLVTVTATGTLQPINQVDVGSEVSGIIDRVLVDFNATVKAGQVLAELDTQQLDARVASANAALAVAQASLVQAQATVTETAAKVARSRDLASKNIASQQSLETDDAAAQRAVAAVASAKAQVTSAQASLKDARDGAVESRDPLADRRHGDRARDRSGPDRRGYVPDARAVQGRGRPAPHGAASRHRRVRHRPGARGPARAVSRRRVSRQGFPGRDHVRAFQSAHGQQRRDL